MDFNDKFVFIAAYCRQLDRRQRYVSRMENGNCEPMSMSCRLVVNICEL